MNKSIRLNKKNSKAKLIGKGEKNEKTKNAGAGTVVKAALTGIVMFFLLLLPAAFVFYKFMPKSSCIPTVFYIIMYLCAFVTGVRASAPHKNKGYIRGLISGIIYALILTVVFIFLKKPFTAKACITTLITLLISAAGGVAGINTK